MVSPNILEEVFTNLVQRRRASCDRTPYYSTCNSVEISNPAWMAEVSDDRMIRHMTIPGTHDSAALYDEDVFWPIPPMFAKCQSLTVTAQLNAGIRFLDIRLKADKNELKIYHGSVYMHDNFKGVLEEIRTFLDKNPTEGLIMRVMKEGDIKGDKSKPFRDLVQERLEKGVGCHLVEKTKLTDDLPLKDLRKKVLILQDFKGDRVDGSIVYDDLIRGDFWNIENSDDVEKKKKLVIEHLNKANDDANNLYLTALSGVGKFIGGVKAVAEEVNPIVKDYERWLNDELDKSNGFGIVVSDFPGEQLIESTILMNMPNKDLNSCISLDNVADEKCNFYNPPGVGIDTEKKCMDACEADAKCTGYQFFASDKNCDLVKGRCGNGSVKSSKGEWNYVSKGCFKNEDRDVCYSYSNVADEVCHWYKPSDYRDKDTDAKCGAACKADVLCSGYQFRESDKNCDLVKGPCGNGQIKKSKGVWSYKSRACLTVPDYSQCFQLKNVADEICNWYNPTGNTQSEEECQAACKADAKCSGYQFRESDKNCDLVTGPCGDGPIKDSKGAWSYVSKGCFKGTKL